MVPEGFQLEQLLAANRTFYRAFGERDWPAMEDLWARRAPLACIHPGWAPLIDRDSVLDSWRRILANPLSLNIRCHGEQGMVFGTSGLVVCRELVDGQMLVASNLFVVEDGIWRMVHHQSGPLARQTPDDSAPSRLLS